MKGRGQGGGGGPRSDLSRRGPLCLRFPAPCLLIFLSLAPNLLSFINGSIILAA